MNIPFFRRFKTYGPRMILDVLEERIVLDASVAPSADKNQQDHQTGTTTNDQAVQQTATVSTGTAATTPSGNQANPTPDPAQQVFNQDLHVVLISNALGQIDAISKAAASDAKVITYDGQKGDLQTIVNDLKSLVDSTGHKIEQLEILSYGQAGILQLSENSLFSAGTVSSNPTPWETLGSLLTANAKIDFFGCNIGQGADGASLVNTISSVTHATVWASSNTTGNGANSDWVLETHSGESNLGSVLDTNVLDTLNVTLDNSNMNNPGFETGNFTGWARSTTTDTFIVSSNPGTYGGIDAGASPFAASGSVWMARLDDNDTGGGDQEYIEGSAARISQTFTYSTADHLVFAYNMVTSDGYNASQDYTGWDNFGYKVSVTHAGVTTDVVNVLYHSGDVIPNIWKLLRHSGWQTVDIDLSQYAAIGDSITVQFQAGNTEDNQYDSWMYVDMQRTTGTSQSLSTHGVLDTTVFEDAASTVKNLDNIFADSLYANSQITLSVLNNTNNSLFSSVTVDANHQLTLDYAPDAYGTALITLHAVDPALHMLDYTFKVTVLPVDDDPTAVSQGYTTGLGGPIEVTLTGYDPDNHPLAAVSFTTPTFVNATHGTLSNPSAITSDGQGHYYQTYTYTPPNSTFAGNDPFTYELTTPSGNWNNFNGGASLATETRYVQSMELSDVDNDGYPELVTAVTNDTAGNNDHVNYYYSNTNGTFGNPTQLGNDSSDSQSIVTGDIDGDGQADLVVFNGNNDTGKYYLWQTSGYAGTDFGTGVNITGMTTGTGVTAGVIAIGDMNGDGLKDLVTGTSGGRLTLFRNIGNHSFDTGVTIATGLGDIQTLAVGDLNNDGYLDIVVGRNGALTQVYQGHANGTFTLAATLPNTSSGSPITYSVAVGDVDGDGLVDIVEANYANNNNAGINKFYLNTGNFGFTEDEISGDRERSGKISLADVDHDGDLDALVSNGGNYNTDYFNKCYIFDSGSLSYTSTVNIGISAAKYFASAAGDVNNDGYTDFVVGQWNTTNNTTNNILYTNQGLSNQDSASATVNITSLGSNLIKNPNFDNNYANWYLETDDLPPLASSDVAGTFAILHPGDTVVTGQTVLDHNSGHSQMQWSWYLPLTIPGTADSNNEVAVQLTTGPHHGWLMQDFYIPKWSTVNSMQLEFDIAYWNHLGEWHAGTQDLAVYVYDVDNANPQPLWIATQGTDSTITEDALGNDVFKHVTYQLPTALLGQNVTLAIEMSSLENFMEFAVDNFKITATFATFMAYNPTLPGAPALGSVFGPGGTPPVHIAGGVLPGMTSMSMVLAEAALQTPVSADSSLTILGSAIASDTTSLAATTDNSPLMLTTTDTILDTYAISVETSSATTAAATTTYTAVTLASPDLVQIAPDPAPTTGSTTPDLLAQALTPADSTSQQASSDNLSGTVFASIDKGDSRHDHSFDLRTALIFDLDDMSPLHLLSLNAPVPVNPLEMSETAILGERLSTGRSVVVSLDSMRFSDILG